MPRRSSTITRTEIEDEYLGVMFAGGCRVKKIAGDMTFFMTGIRLARCLEALVGQRRFKPAGATDFLNLPPLKLEHVLQAGNLVTVGAIPTLQAVGNTQLPPKLCCEQEDSKHKFDFESATYDMYS